MTAVIFIGVGSVILAGLWLYAQGLPNVLTAIAIALLKHAQGLRIRHQRRERRLAEQLQALSDPTFEYLAANRMLPTERR